MRTLLLVRIPVESGNKAIKDGSIQTILERTLNDLHPEASYFFAQEGKRTALFVFDLKETSEIPRIAERFFLELDATVDFIPVMNAEELKKGIGAIEGAAALA